jgi:hypothetical protein
MKIWRLASLLLLPSLVIPPGCIRSRLYRPVGQLTPLQVPRAPDATDTQSIAQHKLAMPIGTRCLSKDGTQPSTLTPAGAVDESGPCLAFVEYDTGGNHFKKGKDQIQIAADLLAKAIQDDPQHQPIILGFVHGWKHNANPGNAGPGDTSEWPPEDDNIQGFEHVLNYLYRCYYADPAIDSPCMAGERRVRSERVKAKGHVVVGVFFGWYGANISPYFPVAQQLTVYTRGNEADLVGKARIFSADIRRLSEIAHPTPKPVNEPMFVLVGHSYGARLLEQGVEEPMKERIEQQLKASSADAIPTFADLVLYVNSAAPAQRGISMLNFLARNKVQYRKTLGDRTAEPLLAAITTPADAATGIIFTIAMSPISWAHGGKQPVACFNPDGTGTSFTVQQDMATLYRNTLGHLKEFQSHTVVDIGSRPESSCAIATNPGSFLYFVPDHCFRVDPATAMTGWPARWNGTPYWVMSTDGNIIPDHGTIFTNRFLRFVGHILPDEQSKALVTGEWNGK